MIKEIAICFWLVFFTANTCYSQISKGEITDSQLECMAIDTCDYLYLHKGNWKIYVKSDIGDSFAKKFDATHKAIDGTKKIYVRLGADVYGLDPVENYSSCTISGFYMDRSKSLLVLKFDLFSNIGFNGHNYILLEYKNQHIRYFEEDSRNNIQFQKIIRDYRLSKKVRISATSVKDD
jgi:hypothetical protein